MFNSLETDSLILPQYVLSLHKIEELKRNLDDVNDKLHSERKKRKIVEEDIQNLEKICNHENKNSIYPKLIKHSNEYYIQSYKKYLNNRKNVEFTIQCEIKMNIENHETDKSIKEIIHDIKLMSLNDYIYYYSNIRKRKGYITFIGTYIYFNNLMNRLRDKNILIL